MKLVFSLIALSLWHWVECQNKKPVTYWNNIWNSSIEAARAFERPTRNEDFAGFNTTNCNAVGSYDFIIVGGGSSGLIVANRLSEISNWTVLVIEAGGNENDFSLIPAATFANYLTPLTWGYLSTPQKNACQGCVNSQCDLTTGRVLGGSSALSAMVHVRGNRRDFDDWERMGNTGWSYKDVLPYFIKSENVTFPVDEGYHGFNGPIMLSHVNPTPSFESTVVQGQNEIGLPALDYNGREQLGVSATQLAINNGRKSTVGQAYFVRRPNLKVITNAYVTKVNFNGNQAAGVTFLNSGNCFTASANKEVILAGGTYNNAQLLMLSGVGPSDELQRHNITPLADLPVGRNLEDHPALIMIHILNNMTMDPINVTKDLEDYSGDYSGRLASPPTMQVSFIVTENSEDSTWPDVEMVYGQPRTYFYFGFEINKKCSNFNDEMDAVIKSARQNNLYFVFILMRPKSRGTLNLQSADPIDFPIIDPQLLGHPDDTDTIYKAVMKTLPILETEAFRKINASLPRVPIKKCQDLPEREYWLCLIRYKTTSLYHPTGSTRMGTNTTDSVVDSNMMVHGLENLRVIGASSIPKIPVDHTNSVVFMIGEKIADTIKSTYM